MYGYMNLSFFKPNSKHLRYKCYNYSTLNKETEIPLK